ncbi:HlyD family secretion protein [Azospirillum himalayense]|uniref:HlyD family secretion protein n=2 Tax=Azospirillum himalayense TaxID=654847 RepID=A0ABW0GDV8_9PROT
MSDKPLFRNDFIKSRDSKGIGTVIDIGKTPLTFAAAFLVLCSLSIALFIVFGTYTKRTSVSGQIVPVAGLMKIYAPQSGRVIERRVNEGEEVKKNDIIFLLSGERDSATQGATQEIISNQIRLRLISLNNEEERTKISFRDEEEYLKKQIRIMKDEIEKSDKQITIREKILLIARKNFERYQDLHNSGYVSRERFEEKSIGRLDEEAHLESLRREHLRLSRDLVDRQNSLDNQAVRYSNQLAEIARSIASAQAELAESEVRREIAIRAPQSGVATAVTAMEGQVIDGSRPLVSIVPGDAELEGHLYATSRTIGFVKPGDAVRLRYHAFPYQKFGQYQGRVTSVSRTALPVSEFTDSPGLASSGLTNAAEPSYRITVHLQDQAVVAYGAKQPIRPGMLVDATIEQETRRLYEWLLEPLYTLKGSL